MKPQVENAPGLIWRPVKRGWEARWQARTDLIGRGFLPKSRALWTGAEPTPDEAAYISDQCQRLQSDMLTFSSGLIAEMNQFDGKTLGSLIKCYQTDPSSRYHKKRYATRRNHDTLLKRIVARHGDERLADINARTILIWYEEWSNHGQMLATWQAIRGLLRVAFSFGFALLEDAECDRLCRIMSSSTLAFEMPSHRKHAITADQVIAVRTAARELFGWDSMALAQALQFELILRQKDVIGEWVPLSEPGLSDITWKGQKWIRGMRWEEVDQNLILTHTTSKKQKPIEADLRMAPMVMEELGILAGVEPSKVTRDMFPATGAVVYNTITTAPWSECEFRRKWRKVAAKAGVPAHVFNMDSRSGGITEARDSGAPVDDIRRTATHSSMSTTEGYIRGQVDANARSNVMRIRVEKRNKPKTE